MAKPGHNEGFHVLDDFVCEAIHDPSVPLANPAHQGRNEGMSVLEEVVFDTARESKPSDKERIQNSPAENRTKHMATRAWLLTVSVLVEQDEELAAKLGPGWRTDNELQEVVTAALAQFLAKRPDVAVEWESMTSTPLDGKPAVGRCAVCNRWVYDAENRT